MPRRSSVTSLSTPESDANERQQQALQLENELEAALTAKNDRLVNTCRMRLCEIFSDWIMSCPMTAMQFDAVGRLWKLCFYGRIGPARAKLLKAKRKHKQENTAIIVQQQERLQAFLAEGVTLLDFLCDKLLEQLSQKITSSPGNKMKINAAGIVPCLHRLYIHLGDLFRYGSHYKKALTAYERAAQLAPAQGHAYNQLAVTTQVQDTSEERRAVAITVYWYVRSLAAQKEPFVTAMTNLQRLLQQNHQWLQKQQTSTTATMTTNTTVLAGQISRNFLASFCDLQYDFLFPSEEKQQQQQNNIAERTTHAATLLQQLLGSSALGESLLFKLVAIAAFSQWHGATDNNSNPQTSNEYARTATLVWGTCMAERVATLLQSKQNKSSKNQQLNTNVRGLGPLLLLTEFVLNYENNNDGEDAAASETFWQAIIRVYNLLHSMTEGSDTITEATELSLFPEYQHWQGFAPFASFVIAPPPQQPYAASSGYATTATINHNDTEYAYISDKEAVALLVQPEHSNDIRQQQKQQSTQQSGSIHSNSQRSSNTGSSNSNASLLRVKRFLCLRLVEMVPRIQQRTTENILEWNDDSTGAFARNYHAVDVVDTDGDAFMDDNHAMDVNSRNDYLLVYQQDELGGPALLVPGALMLLNQQQQQIPESTCGLAASVTLPSHHNPVLPALLPRESAAGATTPAAIVPPPAANTVRPTVLPPPGFGQAPPLIMSIGTDLGRCTHAEGLTGGRSSSILEALLTRSNTETAPFASGPPAVTALHGASNQVNTVDDNKRFYSLFSQETTTANPFASLNCSSNNTATSGSSLVVDDCTFYNNYTHRYQHDTAFLGGDAVMEGGEGGMELLDSGLLNSLLFENHSVGNVAEESSASQQHLGHSATTKNPFAA